jgi:hypothetical protein
LGYQSFHTGLCHERQHQWANRADGYQRYYYHAAIYAQMYQGGNGKRYVVLTNKGSNAVPVQITQDGVEVTNQLLETFVTGSDPRAFQQKL